MFRSRFCARGIVNTYKIFEMLNVVRMYDVFFLDFTISFTKIMKQLVT